MTNEELLDRLTPEALELFDRMVELHVGSSGDRLFIQSDTMAGSSLLFRGDGGSESINSLDRGALEDIARYGFLHVGHGGRGTPNYRVSGDGLAFHRWLHGERSGGGEGPAVLTAAEMRQLEVVLRKYEEAIDAGELEQLDPEDRAELAAEMETVAVQQRSPHPKRSIVRAALSSAGRILEAASGTAIGAGLVAAIEVAVKAL